MSSLWFDDSHNRWVLSFYVISLCQVPLLKCAQWDNSTSGRQPNAAPNPVLSSQNKLQFWMTMNPRYHIFEMTFSQLLSSSLSVRNLHSNGLTDTIPPLLGNLAQLQYLYILDPTSCDCNLNDIVGYSCDCWVRHCQGSPQQLSDWHYSTSVRQSHAAAIPVHPYPDILWMQFERHWTLDIISLIWLFSQSLSFVLDVIIHLSVRDLSLNTLNGTIPPQFGNLTQLQTMYSLQ